MASESDIFRAEVAAVEQWWKVRRRHSPTRATGTLPYPAIPALVSLFVLQEPRFAKVVRPYTAEQVVAKRGTLAINYPSDIQGKKLWKILAEHAKNGTPSHTYGA